MILRTNKKKCRINLFHLKIGFQENRKILSFSNYFYTQNITFYPIAPSIINGTPYILLAKKISRSWLRCVEDNCRRHVRVYISSRVPFFFFFFFPQRETTPRNSARLVSLLSCARIEQLRLARTPLFHSATASRRVIVTLANFASTILHAATRHAWNRRFVPAFSSFLLIRHCSEKNHPWWAVLYGMCNSKLLLEQINLKSEKWIRGMEIVENNFETDIFLNL